MGGQSQMGAGEAATPPILDAKHHASPPVFRPENLLREARQQRRLAELPVPEICILDPDGDIVRALRADGRGRPFPGWACYHTEMLSFELAGLALASSGAQLALLSLSWSPNRCSRPGAACC
jgi:hypothetical protein